MPFAVAVAVAVPGRPISERHNVRGRCHTTRHGSSLEVPRFVDRVLFSLYILLNNFFWCAPILNVVCSDRGKGTRCRIACVLCLPPVPPPRSVSWSCSAFQGSPQLRCLRCEITSQSFEVSGLSLPTQSILVDVPRCHRFFTAVWLFACSVCRAWLPILTLIVR